ncbi:MAG: hypothetical protein HY943_17675 [Gammaproteobacteria bacterium]|nr:hypothetical protein [Gammaproteobacteria bacterium]
MTRRRIRAALLLATLTAPLLGGCPPAPAADKDGNYAVWGLGQSSCNQFLRTGTAPGMSDQYASFVMGFLTAFNALAPETYQATGNNGLQDNLDWLKTYCEAHRTDGFERAIVNLLAATRAQRFHSLPGSAPGWGRPQKPKAE